MKDSSEWVRQPMVDKAADEIAAERGCHPSEVKPYWVAKKLGVEHNGALSEKVFDWRRRRLAEDATLTVAVPTHAETEFRDHFEQLGRDAVAIFRRTVATIGSELDRAATLRITDAERRRDQAEVDRDDLLVICRKAEAECAALHAQLSDLQQQLEDARRSNERLLGRLEERDRDGQAQRPPMVERPANETRPNMAAFASAPANGPPDDPDVVLDDDASGQMAMPLTANAEPVPVANQVKDQLPAIATPPGSGAQGGMPIVDDANADKADGGDYDRS